MKPHHLTDIPDLEHYSREFAWNMHPTDPMSMVIYHWSKPVMKLSLHEAIESSSRKAVLRHILECDSTPWLTRWQQEKKDMEQEAIIKTLTREYANGE